MNEQSQCVSIKKQSHPTLENLKLVAKAIAATFGSRCEVVVHDLRNPENSIVEIINGHVTGRKIGGPATDLVLRILRSGKLVNNMLLNYETKTKNGRRLKSSTIFFKEGERIAFALCINYDLSDFLLTKSLVDQFCATTNLDVEDGESPETFEVNVERVLKELIQKAINKVGIPVAHMQKEDKMKVVKFLDERGAFLIKGAQEKIAKELGVSRYSIYNYLEELRADKDIMF